MAAQRKRVLLVVPETTGNGAKEALERAGPGLDVTGVGGGDAARSRITSGGVDCVVAEPRLPDDDGIDLLARTTENGIPGIAWPADGDEALAASAFRRGVADYVPRGDPDESGETLVERIYEALDSAGQVPRKTRDATAVLDAVHRALMLALHQGAGRDRLWRVTCNRVVAADEFRLAWYGTVDVGTDRVTPDVWAGIERNFVEGRALALDGTEDGVEVRTRLFDERRPVVRQFDESPSVSRPVAQGFRCVAYVPVVHGATVHGVLAVYGGLQSTFDATRRTALVDVGRSLGYALTAGQRTRRLVANERTELEYRVTDDRLLTVGLSAELDCRVTLRDVSLNADSTATVYLDIDGASPTEAARRARTRDRIEDATVASDDGSGGVLQVTYTDSSLAEYLAEQGAVLRVVTAESGEGISVIELAAGANVRELTERIAAAYGDTELVARRNRSGRDDAPWTFRDRVEDDLTARQMEALRTAHYGGFFDWPRENTGEALAESLGISQPTYLQHLRTAEGKLFSAFFDSDSTIYNPD